LLFDLDLEIGEVNSVRLNPQLNRIEVVFGDETLANYLPRNNSGAN